MRFPGSIATALLLALSLNASASANDEDPGGFARVSFGVKGGLALAQHQGIEPRNFEYTVSSSMRTGFAGGLFVELPVNRRFSLQSELLYVQKGSRQIIGVEIFEIPTDLSVTYDMNYLEIPTLLRYGWIVDRAVDFYSLAGFAFAIKMDGKYELSGTVDDGEQQVPITAEGDLSEVDLFDFAFTYGMGIEFPVDGLRCLFEYRFDLSVEALLLPTYAEVPFGDESIEIDNEPVPLRNQTHMLMIGVRF